MGREPNLPLDIVWQQYMDTSTAHINCDWWPREPAGLTSLEIEYDPPAFIKMDLLDPWMKDQLKIFALNIALIVMNCVSEVIKYSNIKGKIVNVIIMFPYLSSILRSKWSLEWK